MIYKTKEGGDIVFAPFSVFYINKSHTQFDLEDCWSK